MRFHQHNVLVDRPHPQSLASLVMLTRQLCPKPVSYKVWLKYRKWVLREVYRQFKKLQCAYCQRDDLLATTENFKRLATLDHIMPRSRGGAEYARSNLAVACFPCNQRKKDHLPT